MKTLKNKIITSALAVCVLIAFSSCDATRNANNKQKGAVIGAASGAILGAIIGNNVGKGGNGEIGAVIGGVVGGDKRMARWEIVMLGRRKRFCGVLPIDGERERQ